ncbi:matrix-remodeling-associated protein 7 isoform 3-T3 [Polymixia lowei]
MDLTFILSAIIFTLLAIVVATSIFNGSSSSADFARGCFGQTGEAKAGGLNSSDLKQNCHLPGEKKAVEDWGEVSGSSHDHWDVVKSVLSEETHSHLDTEERATPTEGAAESPGINDKVEANANNSLKYVPGVMRTNHMQMMMSKDELEQEQRIEFTTDFTSL